MNLRLLVKLAFRPAPDRRTSLRARPPFGAKAAFAAVCFAVGALAGQPAFSQQESTSASTPPATAEIPLDGARFIAVGASVTYDTNFFRDPGLVFPIESETITTAYAGFRIDKPYAQQRFFLDITATAYRYAKFSELDFDALNYFAAWYWHLTPRITGTLSASRNQLPTQFAYTLSRQSNVTTNESYLFDLAGQVFGGWYVLLGASQYDRKSELSSLQSVPDYTESRAEAGIRYRFGSGSQIDALARRIDGEQAGQVIGGVVVAGVDNYKEDQAELRASWLASARSTVTARLTHLDRRYDNTPQFDFSGTAGELRVAWLPTAKVDLIAAATRNLYPFQGGIQSNYRVSNAISLEPAWRPTVTTRLYMTVRLIDEQYPLAASGGTEREDRISQAVLGLDWRAARNLTFGAALTYEERSSNIALVEYDVTLARLSATLLF